MLPEMDGYQVLRHIRQGDRHVPVIILSARGEEADKVRGFKLDADQYVTKPFSIVELLERIAALLRRSARPKEEPAVSRMTFGDVDIDVAARTVMRNGEPCALTPKAYELLLALVKRDGAVVGRNELLKEVWGYGPHGGYSHCRASSQARDKSRRAEAHCHGVESRISICEMSPRNRTV